MKTLLFKSSLLVSLFILVLSGCNQNPSTRQSKGKNAASIDTVAFRSKIAELIQQSPKGITTFAFLKETGASYINGLTLPLSNVEKYETKQEMSLAIGVYGADMNYSNICQRPDMAVQEGEVVAKLLGKLGVQNNIPNSMKNLEGLAKYADNKDSVAVFTERVSALYHLEKSSKNPEIYPLVFIGANIETFYLLTQLALFSSTKQPMLECLYKQGDLAKTLLSLLEILSADETIKPYYEKMKPIVAYFDEHPGFTENELKGIAPLIDVIRNDMLR